MSSPEKMDIHLLEVEVVLVVGIQSHQRVVVGMDQPSMELPLVPTEHRELALLHSHTADPGLAHLANGCSAEGTPIQVLVEVVAHHTRTA